MPWYQQLSQAVGRLITTPMDELSRAQRSARYVIDLVRHCARQLSKDRAAQMAAALTYHTLFGMLPMIVLAMVLLTVMADDDSRERFKETVIESLLPQPGVTVVDSEAERKLQEGREYLSNELQRLMDAPKTISFGGISIVGVLVFVFGATGLLRMIERSFNTIFDSARNRPWFLRVALYFTVITLGPVVLIFAQIFQEKMFEEFRSGSSTHWLVGPAALLLPLAATWLAIFLVYVLMPTAKVNKRAAAVGSFVAAVLWIITKDGFRIYVANAGNTMYGALALLPLFLLWLWLTWLIILFGLELTYTLQTLKGRQDMEEQARREAEVLGDPMWLVPIMAQIGRAFAEGKTVTTDDLADSLRLPVRCVGQFAQKLEEHGLIHRVVTNGHMDEGYALAQPPANIRIDQLIDLGREITSRSGDKPSGPGWSVLDQLAQAQKDAAGQTSLESLLNDGAAQDLA